MAPIEKAFIDDIVQNPEDMTPRLIYADWLEERGDPRGEFIRVQMELHRLEFSVLCHQREQTMADWCDDSDCPKCGPSYNLRRREGKLWPNAASILCRPVLRLLNWVSYTCDRSSLVYLGPFVNYVRRIGAIARRGFIEVVCLSPADWLTHADALRKVCPIRDVRLVPAREGDAPSFSLTEIRERWRTIQFHFPAIHPLPDLVRVH